MSLYAIITTYSKWNQRDMSIHIIHILVKAEKFVSTKVSCKTPIDTVVRDFESNSPEIQLKAVSPPAGPSKL